ncbi:MAG: hypothetical protein DWQ01_04940 [Planctomycetota bacterium]|nr:MAG: hypothetical protein DWQ01_04940 [Planctomycetota bacterium]
MVQKSEGVGRPIQEKDDWTGTLPVGILSGTARIESDKEFTEFQGEFCASLLIDDFGCPLQLPSCLVIHGYKGLR